MDPEALTARTAALARSSRQALPDCIDTFCEPPAEEAKRERDAVAKVEEEGRNIDELRARNLERLLGEDAKGEVGGNIDELRARNLERLLGEDAKGEVGGPTTDREPDPAGAGPGELGQQEDVRWSG